jgi:hypothetical protein
MSEIPISGKDLALYMGRSSSYISAMKSAGYEFTHGTRTLLSSALAWLSEHPDFRSTGYRISAPGFVKDQARSERARVFAALRKRRQHLPPATSDTNGELAHSHD